MSTPPAVRSVRQALRDAQRSFGAYTGSLTELTEQLGVDHLHEEVTQALEHMERSGEVEIERTNKSVTSFRYRGLPATKGTKIARSKDRHRAKPMDARERMFARDFGDDLSDLPCTPVHTSRIKRPVRPLSKPGVASPQNLTSALNALRNDCDGNRVLQSVSGIAVIQEAMGCSFNQAAYLFSALGKLELSESTRLGLRKWQIVIKMQPAEVTHEMAQRAKWLLNKRHKNENESIIPDSKDTLPVIVCMEEQEVEAEPMSELDTATETQVLTDEVVEKLARIVKKLEQDKQELQERVAQVESENNTLTEENSQLQLQLNHRPVVNADVQDILSRYQS